MTAISSESDNNHLKTAIETAGHRLQVALHLRPRGFCLITGCPRSGTSAVNAWLGGHKQVARFTESRILVAAHRFVDEVTKFEHLFKNKSVLLSMIRRDIFAFYASKKLLWRKQLIDKEPLEHIAIPDLRYREFLRNFQLIFPEAKLLFIIRDPIPTIWSMAQRKWGYSLTQKELQNFTLEDYVNNWNSCAEIITEFAAKENVHVCRFEHLIASPKDESRRIFDFLDISHDRNFQPKSTSTPAFNSPDREFILNETKRQHDMVLRLVAISCG